MKFIPGKISPKNWSRRQRHETLNRALGYHSDLPIFQHIAKKDGNSQLVLDYKNEFLRQVYGKKPYDPIKLTNLLVNIGKEMREETDNALLGVPNQKD